MISNIRLSDVYLDLRRIKKGAPVYTTLITDSLFYRCLVENDRTIYDEYREGLRRTSSTLDRQMTYDEFVNLGNSILKNGWATEFYIHLRKFRKGVAYKVTDGAHRSALLLYVFGDIELKCVSSDTRGRWGLYLPVIKK